MSLDEVYCFIMTCHDRQYTVAFLSTLSRIDDIILIELVRSTVVDLRLRHLRLCVVVEPQSNSTSFVLTALRVGSGLQDRQMDLELPEDITQQLEKFQVGSRSHEVAST